MQDHNTPQRLCVTHCEVFDCVNGAKKAPEMWLRKPEVRQNAHGDKIIFFPHSVDNIIPD